MLMSIKITSYIKHKYMNCELSDVQACFRKGRGTRDQIANIRWITEKAREFQKNIYLCFIDYTKAFYCVDHNKLWEILQEMGIPNHPTCLLRNLYAGQGWRPGPSLVTLSALDMAFRQLPGKLFIKKKKKSTEENLSGKPPR